MNGVRTIKGTVRSVQGSTPGPSSGISYTIVYEEEGSVVVLDGQVPMMRQWIDDVDIDGQACVGKPVNGLMTEEGRIWWWFAERPVALQCGGGAQALRASGGAIPIIPVPLSPKSVPGVDPGAEPGGPSTGIDG